MATVIDSDHPPIQNLEPGKEGVLVIEQLLLEVEVENIRAHLTDHTADFWLGNLNIPISVENISQYVETKRLHFGDFEHISLSSFKPIEYI